MTADYFMKFMEEPIEPPEPDPVCTCGACGEPIYEGEDFYEFEGECYCEDCFEDNAVKILVDNFGAKRTVAEFDDFRERW